MKKFFVLMAISLGVGFTQCARNPVTGKKQVVFMSEAQEIAMGQEADPQIIAQYGLYENKDLQDFINEKGKAMAAVSHRPQLDYKFRIVDSEILNAFAVPGGYVYFTRGIMAHFNDEAQFAGVLGHEIGHITARHSVVQQRNAMLGQLGIIAGLVISPEFAQFAESASQGLSLLFLKFGRDDERQGDQLGVEYSTKIGYDAHHMANFFTTLERQGTKSGAAELPEFLSTHPNPGDRHNTVEKLATEWQNKLNLKNPATNRNAYLKRIEGLVYGEDPRQGFLENSVFYHPELKFQFPVPQGWNYQNTPQRVQMAPADGKALMYLTLAKGNSLEEAARAMAQANGLQISQLQQTSVNGLDAVMMVADAVPQQQQQQQQQQPLRTLSYFIQQGSNMYQILGVSASQNFAAYQPAFLNTMRGFKTLTDAAKINRQPERIRIKTLASSTTFEQAMKSYNMPSSRYEELAILNGMQLKDQIEKGTMIKVIGQ
ncbi:MAG: peptidase M48 [Chitinophagaceae bacterium]|nr:MAG: peptidase M48 [Chitinophagaceae bacterium]